MSVDDLLAALWRDYTASTAQAERIHALLSARGERVVNDHVALRGLAAPGLGIAALARPFEALGWQPRDRYAFADKKLDAQYWQHPDPALPKVFISELRLGDISTGARWILERLIAQVPAGFADRADLPWAGRPWALRRGDYTELLAESEYAAWVAAFGMRVNHFTVSVNALTTFERISQLCTFLMEHGFLLNDAGGVMKGSRLDGLVQVSTRADRIEVAFSDGTLEVPSCYYELAQRYAVGRTRELFQGFVPASADKIFESTNVKR